MDSYAGDVREHWVLSWPGQIVLCVSQTYWTADVHKSIRSDCGRREVAVVWGAARHTGDGRSYCLNRRVHALSDARLGEAKRVLKEATKDFMGACLS